jgi:hypothetical protein
MKYVTELRPSAAYIAYMRTGRSRGAAAFRVCGRLRAGEVEGEDLEEDMPHVWCNPAAGTSSGVGGAGE